MAHKTSIGRWNVEAVTGYKPKTTFWDDFSIADIFGADAVRDTFNRAFSEWKNDTEYLTELVLVLNHKIWQHYEHNEPLARVYDELWKKADLFAVENLTGDDLTYFYNITD